MPKRDAEMEVLPPLCCPPASESRMPERPRKGAARMTFGRMSTRWEWLRSQRLERSDDVYHRFTVVVLLLWILFYAPPWRSILFPSCPFATEVVVSVRNGSQLTGVPWDLRLAGHTSATHKFLVSPKTLLIVNFE